MANSPTPLASPDVPPSVTKAGHLYDVLIVGAGPVGLATALGLKERGIDNIRVIDKTRAFRNVGQQIDVLPNGLKALKTLSIESYEAFVKTHTNPAGPVSTGAVTDKPHTIPKWVYRNLSGEPIHTITLSNDDWLKKYGEGRVSTSWYGLQTFLRECLPAEWVQANCGCVGFREDTTTGIVHIEGKSNTRRDNPYAHWATVPKGASASQKTSTQTVESPLETATDLPTQSTEDSISPMPSSAMKLSARLVVAADGINSTMRQALYQGHDYERYAKPEYSGFSAIFCRAVAAVPEPLATALNESFFRGEFLVTVCGKEVCPEPIVKAAPRIMMFRRGTKWGFMIHAALPIEQLQGKSGQSLVHEAKQILAQANFPSAMQQLVELALPEAIQQRPYYIHRAESGTPWTAGRVVLVGDAAHGMPPFMAQGVNQGFEDAATIVPLIAQLIQQNNLDEPSAIATAFQQYEQQRRPRVIRTQASTLAKTTLWSVQERQNYNQALFCP